MPPTLRLYCEMIPHERLLGSAFEDFFQGFRGTFAPTTRVELILRVDLLSAGAPLPEALCALLRDPGRLAMDKIWLWGQLPDRHKVYLNLRTWPAVLEGWHHLLDALEAEGLSPDGLLFDLEPALDTLRLIAALDPRALWSLRQSQRGQSYDAEVARLRQALATLRARCPEVPVSAACVPVAGLGCVSHSLERFLGTPVLDALGGTLWPELSAMIYLSFLNPYVGQRGAAPPWIHRRLGAAMARAHVTRARRAGASGNVICGLTGVGALGDEPVFASPAAMRPLLEAAAEAGPDALEIFNVLGLISPGRLEDRWRDPDPVIWRAWAQELARHV